MVQINKFSHTVLRTKARVVKFKHDSHCLTGKSEQNITANLSGWNPPEKGRRLGVTFVRGAMHSGKKWRSVLWLNAMHSGKK